jgi:hypothetical protein
MEGRKAKNHLGGLAWDFPLSGLFWRPLPPRSLVADSGHARWVSDKQEINFTIKGGSRQRPACPGRRSAGLVVRRKWRGLPDEHGKK